MLDVGFWTHVRIFSKKTLFAIGDTPVTVATLAAVFIVLVCGYLLSRLVRSSVRRGFARRNVREGTSAAVQRLIHYVMLIVTFSIAIQTLGINLGALFAAGAVFAVAIGFAMQTIAQNFVSGVLLLLERSIKPGDILSLEGRLGRVQAMRIRSTIVESFDGTQLVVPNSLLVQSTVKNYTLDNSEVRVRIKVGVSYSSDMAHVDATLRKVGDAIHFRSPNTETQVLLTGFGNSSVDWELAVWMNDPWELRASISSLNRSVWDAFAAEGITIAFPQVDVHFDAPVAQGLSRLAS